MQGWLNHFSFGQANYSGGVIRQCWTGIWTGMVEWTMEWTLEWTMELKETHIFHSNTNSSV